MSQKAIILKNGRTAIGHELTSIEADFDRMTWTFKIEPEDTVSGGVYLVIHESELVPHSTPSTSNEEQSNDR